jgi:hypothetical protein
VKVEVLYVAECPSHPAAVKLLRDVLSAEGVAAEIREVLITDDSMATDFALWFSNDSNQRPGRCRRVFQGEGVCLELSSVSGLCQYRAASG